MCLFEREKQPILSRRRSALSRFLAALTEVPVDSLRTIFLDDLESRTRAGDSAGRGRRHPGLAGARVPQLAYARTSGVPTSAHR
jgi:hypothetical protein